MTKTFVRFDLLPIGACFRFEKPPKGWASCQLMKVEKHPGWAAPEGWDYVLASETEIADEMCEVLNETPGTKHAPTYSWPSDLEEIDDKNAKQHRAWPAFVREMGTHTCRYDPEHLSDKWDWFKAGWEARSPLSSV